MDALSGGHILSSLSLLFFYICDARTCITRRIGLSRSAMSDRVALVKLRSLSIGPLREKYAFVRAAGKLQSTLPPLRTRTRVRVLTRNFFIFATVVRKGNNSIFSLQYDEKTSIYAYTYIASLMRSTRD